MRRRQFLFACLPAAIATAQRGVAGPPVPKFGHRQANMVSEPGPAVFDLARRIHGLSGVELQINFRGTTLVSDDTRLTYQRAAERTGLAIPSLAAVWPPGATLLQPTAEENLRQGIRVAESLHASTILVACFERNCPRMDQEQSYGPVVALLQKVSGAARDAGVVLGMETSLSPADDRKLIDLVDRSSIRIYYDLDNVERYGHTGEAVPGIARLQSRIRQVSLSRTRIACWSNRAALTGRPRCKDWRRLITPGGSSSRHRTQAPSSASKPRRRTSLS